MAVCIVSKSAFSFASEVFLSMSDNVSCCPFRCVAIASDISCSSEDDYDNDDDNDDDDDDDNDDDNDDNDDDNDDNDNDNDS